MIYYSKKDWWLMLLVSVAILVPLALGLYNLLAPGGDAQAGRTQLIAGTSTGAIVLLLTYPLYYEITNSELIIRCGFVRKAIPLSSIEEVRPTKKPMSAPAWSLDRLRVDYWSGSKLSFALISPEDKIGFMRDLTRSTVGLQMEGERVVRTL